MKRSDPRLQPRPGAPPPRFENHTAASRSHHRVVADSHGTDAVAPLLDANVVVDLLSTSEPRDLLDNTVAVNLMLRHGAASGYLLLDVTLAEVMGVFSRRHRKASTAAGLVEQEATSSASAPWESHTPRHWATYTRERVAANVIRLFRFTSVETEHRHRVRASLSHMADGLAWDDAYALATAEEIGGPLVVPEHHRRIPNDPAVSLMEFLNSRFAPTASRPAVLCSDVLWQWCMGGLDPVEAEAFSKLLRAPEPMVLVTDAAIRETNFQLRNEHQYRKEAAAEAISHLTTASGLRFESRDTIRQACALTMSHGMDLLDAHLLLTARNQGRTVVSYDGFHRAPEWLRRLRAEPPDAASYLDPPVPTGRRSAGARETIAGGRRKPTDRVTKLNGHTF